MKKLKKRTVLNIIGPAVMGVLTVLLVAAFISTSGCATASSGTWQDSAKKAVVASTKVYDLAMHVAGSSNLSPDKRAEVVKLANVYRAAATAALDAADINDQKSYDAHVAEFSKAIADLSALLGGSK